MKDKRLQLLNPLKIGIVISVVAVLITASVTWFLYEHTVNLLTDNLRQRLLSIVTTQASNLDPIEIESLQVESDWQKPAWSSVVNRLKDAKDRNKDIVFIYIYRKNKDDSSKLEFVADAGSINPYANSDDDPNNDVDANGDGIIEPDGPDFLQWPGQEYPEPPDEAFIAFDGPLTSVELYEDAWGQVLTGYEPIYDSNGDPIAVLAVDIRADDFFTITRQTLYPFMMFVGFLGIIIIALTLLIISIWNARVHVLQELDKQKDELLSIVSHQLATPVSSVKWYIEMLLDGDYGKLTTPQKEQVETIQSVASDLTDLIGMILDVSRIQLGKMKVDSSNFNLGDLFEEILNVIEPKAAEKSIALIKNIPEKMPDVTLDKRLMRITLENLLSNAVKYSPDNSDVILDLKVENNTIYYSIKDSGCGIPKKEQDKIFGKLYRATNVSDVDGNGFGLFASKGAVEAQGGNIRFESIEGKGTTFYVEVPVAI